MAEPSAKAQALRQGGRRRLLTQDPKDSTKWEALQLLGDGPQDFSRSELDTRGAAHYQQEGGFEIVPRAEFDSELSRLSEALRAQRGASSAPAEPPLPPLPPRAASAVADVRTATGEAGNFPVSELEEGLGELYTPVVTRREEAPLSDEERILAQLEAGMDPIQQARRAAQPSRTPVDTRALVQALRGGR